MRKCAVPPCTCGRSAGFQAQTAFTAYGTGQLVLEDRTGQLKFTAFEEQEIRGRKAWITRSESRIRMSMDYPYARRLILNDGTQKRVLLAKVAPPEPEQDLDAPKGILRRIGIF